MQSNKLEGKVGISRDILKYVVLVDCFVDIDRLKEFAHIVLSGLMIQNICIYSLLVTTA